MAVAATDVRDAQYTPSRLTSTTTSVIEALVSSNRWYTTKSALAVPSPWAMIVGRVSKSTEMVAIELDARKRSRECAGEHTTVVVGSIVFAGDESTETRRVPDRDRRYLEHEFSRRAASGSESQAGTGRDGQLEHIAIANIVEGELVGPKCVAKQRQLGVGCCDVECAVWAGKSELFATNGDRAIHETAGGVELQRNVGPSRNIHVGRVERYRTADLASDAAAGDHGQTRQARQAEEVGVVGR